MKALMVMYDSLRRDLLSVYGGPIPAPNFELCGKSALHACPQRAAHWPL